MHSTPLHQAALTRHQERAVETVDRYWHRLAGGSDIPQRSQIDPRAMEDALDYAFIAERLTGGHARFRVAGGSIGTVLGMEIAGMPLAVLVSPEARADFTAQIAALFDTPTKLCLTMIAPAGFGQPALQAQLRLYPLRGAAGAVSQVLGTFVTTGLVGATPRRFGIVSVDAVPIGQPTPLPPVPIARRGHLVLVVSND